jgi:C-terminal processing protease CtpA/Prc
VDVPADVATTDPAGQLASLLAEHYVFPDKAAQAAAVIGQHNAAGGYQGLDEAALGELLTRQLYEVCRDKHLRVSLRDPAEAGRRLRNQFRRQPELENYGIARVERLPGNVGLVDLRSLPSPDLAGRSIAAAMSLVAHTGALIFDLRQNRGGWPECVVFWNSYLFPDGDTLLNTIEARGKEQARQFWTLAAVPGDRYLDRPVYVLTSGTTFSGGEEFAYNLQARGRATLLGEITGGGAHPSAEFSLTPALQVHIPNARSVNPVTGTNWEGTGVRPDIEVPAEQALDRAYRLALEHVADSDSPAAEEARTALLALGREPSAANPEAGG